MPHSLRPQVFSSESTQSQAMPLSVTVQCCHPNPVQKHHQVVSYHSQGTNHHWTTEVLEFHSRPISLPRRPVFLYLLLFPFLDTSILGTVTLSTMKQRLSFLHNTTTIVGQWSSTLDIVVRLDLKVPEQFDIAVFHNSFPFVLIRPGIGMRKVVCFLKFPVYYPCYIIMPVLISSLC